MQCPSRASQEILGSTLSRHLQQFIFSFPTQFENSETTEKVSKLSHSPEHILVTKFRVRIEIISDTRPIVMVL